MGHLLSSVNKLAADRIEDPTLGAPDVGTMVVYIARTGLQRRGKREFPAIVLGTDEDGFLELFVLMEPEDMMLESHVRPRESEFQDQGHCWRHVDLPPIDQDNEAVEALGEAVRAQALVIEGLKADIAEVRKLILGTYQPAKLAVYDLLAEFEGKLKKL